MRLRSLIGWAVALALIAWAGYTAVTAFTSYVATTEMIDQVLRDATQRMSAAPASGQGAVDEVVDDVRDALLLRARRYGVPLESRNLAVSADGRGLVVRAKWSYAVVSYREEPVVTIPMSTERVAAFR